LRFRFHRTIASLLEMKCSTTTPVCDTSATYTPDK
jgi:hypothetical protein